MPHHLFTAKWNTAKYIFHGIFQVGIGPGSAQLSEITGHSTDIFGNRHMVIVKHDDEIRLHLRSIIQCFICHSSGQGSVPDDRDHIIILPQDIPSSGIAQSGRN